MSWLMARLDVQHSVVSAGSDILDAHLTRFVQSKPVARPLPVVMQKASNCFGKD